MNDRTVLEVLADPAFCDAAEEAQRLRDVLEDIAKAHPSEGDQCPYWAEQALCSHEAWVGMSSPDEESCSKCGKWRKRSTSDQPPRSQAGEPDGT